VFLFLRVTGCASVARPPAEGRPRKADVIPFSERRVCRHPSPLYRGASGSPVTNCFKKGMAPVVIIDRRSGAGSGFQRRRRGQRLSSAARRPGAGSDRGDARLGYGQSRRGVAQHMRRGHEELHCVSDAYMFFAIRACWRHRRRQVELAPPATVRVRCRCGSASEAVSARQRVIWRGSSESADLTTLSTGIAW